MRGRPDPRHPRRAAVPPALTISQGDANVFFTHRISVAILLNIVPVIMRGRAKAVGLG